jgi:hypothetical protein
VCQISAGAGQSQSPQDANNSVAGMNSQLNQNNYAMNQVGGYGVGAYGSSYGAGGENSHTKYFF